MEHRYIAGMYLLFRIVYHILDIIILKHKYNYVLGFVTPLSMSLIFGILHPYLTDTYNHLDCVYFGILSFARLWGICAEFITNLPIIVIYMVICVPLFHTIFVVFIYIALPIIKFCYI